MKICFLIPNTHIIRRILVNFQCPIEANTTKKNNFTLKNTVSIKNHTTNENVYIILANINIIVLQIYKIDLP